MRRKGLRLEVDEPTEWQLGNKRWLAEHPGVTALVAAFVFSALGALYATTTSWMSTAAGAIAGLLLGALLGWGFSVEHRDQTPRGTTLALYAAIVVLAMGILVFMKSR